MTILEKIKFEEDWLSEVNLTKENVKIAFAGIRATALEQQPCEDCISRKAVNEIWHTQYCYSREDNDEEQYKRIQALPSVTPQTDILDKIRAEIEEYKSRQLTLAIGIEDLEKGKQIALECVLAIIDKYKAESEEEGC